MTTTYYIDPEDIISDFLRTYLIDPKARAEASHSNTFTATAGQTEFSLTASIGSVSCITSVTINSVTKNKWMEYYWDYQNEKIILFTPLTGSEEVIITFKQGSTNWIYSDRPDEEIGPSSFPRISIFTVGGGGKRLGQYSAPVETSTNLQIDIWARQDQPYTIGEKIYSNEYLTRYIGNQITKAFEEHEDSLFPVLYNYIPISGVRTAPFSDEFNAFHAIVEINIKALRIGRIEV
jgi:hypothetical protein